MIFLFIWITTRQKSSSKLRNLSIQVCRGLSPAVNQAPRSCLLTSPPPPPRSRMGSTIRSKNVKLVGGDKGNLIGQQRERRNTNNNTQNEWCTAQLLALADQCPAHSWAAIPAPQLTPPSLYIEHDVIWYGISLWPVWVSCPGYAPSQFPVHLLSSRAWEAKKSLTWYKHYLATTKVLVCYQHCSHTKFKTQHYTSY